MHEYLFGCWTGPEEEAPRGHLLFYEPGEEAEEEEGQQASTSGRKHSRPNTGNARQRYEAARRRQRVNNEQGCLWNLCTALAMSLGLVDAQDEEIILRESSYFCEANCRLTPKQKGIAKEALLQMSVWRTRECLTLEQVNQMLRLLGHCPDSMRLEAAISEQHMVSTKVFTYWETMHIWSYFLDHRDEEMVMLKRAFQFFDKDSSGCITFEEMQETNAELEEPLSDAELHEFIELLDKNGDGVLQYEDFFGMVESDIEGLNKVLPPANSQLGMRGGRRRSSIVPIGSSGDFQMGGKGITTAMSFNMLHKKLVRADTFESPHQSSMGEMDGAMESQQSMDGPDSEAPQIERLRSFDAHVVESFFDPNGRPSASGMETIPEVSPTGIHSVGGSPRLPPEPIRINRPSLTSRLSREFPTEDVAWDMAIPGSISEPGVPDRKQEQRTTKSGTFSRMQQRIRPVTLCR